MTGRSALLTALLWALLVTSLALLAFPLGDAYRRPVASMSEALARLAAPRDVRLEVVLANGTGSAPQTEMMRFTASRAGQGISTALNTRLLDASAAMLLATVIITPLGGFVKRALWTLLALLAFVIVMGVVAAGLALVPLWHGGFVESRIAGHAAGMAHNVASSGLIISFPAAVWFLSTLPWWRRGRAAGAGRNDVREASRPAGKRPRGGKLN